MNSRHTVNNTSKKANVRPKKFSLFPLTQTLSKIYLEPTAQCNLQCRTCLRNSWDEIIGAMDIKVYRKLLADLEEMPTLNTIAFWGIGEPLFHPDIVTMVALAHKKGLQTEIITNGHLLDQDMAHRLIEAGLDILVVSVDGTDQASYQEIRSGGDLLLVEKNIKTLNRQRAKMGRKHPDVGLEFVITKSNITRLPDLAHTAQSMEAKFIILSNLLPCTEDMKDEITYWISATINEKEELPKKSDELIFPCMDMRLEYLTPFMELLKRLDKPMPDVLDLDQEYCCPFIQKGSAAISWSGEVSPCIALMHSYSCYILGRQKRIRKYSVGNIAQEKFGVIWNKEKYRSFRERVSNFDFSPCVQCSGCNYSETNEQDCFGNSHPVCGDCLWARSVLLCP
ncbi:MAG TPA: SPASM domain-containing protein [Smithella sp.]|nr:SPASM domain-containing protein [Smithella sp.]HQI73265.1 SPASM domain-containing protein [Smithella sp.]